jgi:hypothetical protein
MSVLPSALIDGANSVNLAVLIGAGSALSFCEKT